MYEKLKFIGTSNEVPEEVRKAFEEALDRAWKQYVDSSFITDKLEDNAMELAFSKGFLCGCIFHEAQQIANHVEAENEAVSKLQT